MECEREELLFSAISDVEKLMLFRCDHVLTMFAHLRTVHHNVLVQA